MIWQHCFKLCLTIEYIHIQKDKNNPWDMRRTEEYISFILEKKFTTLDNFHGAVIEKQTNHLIGLCGLNPYKVNEPEIEWKLGVQYWGKGYATELGKQMIKEAFATTCINGIYGMTQPENVASRKVLEKIGMQYIGKQEFRNQKYSFYYIANTTSSLPISPSSANLTPTFKTEYPPPTSGITEQEIRNGFLLFFCPK